jgi:membrane fusion protein (multidrug efflux system)
MSRNVAVVALVLGALTLVLWLLAPEVAERAPVMAAAEREVGVAAVVEQSLEEHIEALGTTAAWESIEIRPTVTEFVAAIHFDDGQSVEKGRLLVTLVQDEERAGIVESRAVLEEQEREMRRIEGLVARKSLPANQLDERRTQRDIALARLSAAEAALADRTIRAPFAGTLGLRGPSPGALVTPETVITTLDDVAMLRLDFPVPSLLLAKLRLGSPVEATTPARPGERFRGEVIGIDTRVNPVDRSVMVRARLDNTRRLLKPGLVLNVDLFHERRTALVVPEEALIQYQREHYVFVLDRESRIARRDVAIGLRQPGIVEILSGLAAGEQVVTEGVTAVKPGDKVRIGAVTPTAAPR